MFKNLIYANGIIFDEDRERKLPELLDMMVRKSGRRDNCRCLYSAFN